VPAEHQRRPAAPGVPPYYPRERRSASVEKQEHQAREMQRARALEGVPKLSERASARPAKPVELTTDEAKVNSERAAIFSQIIVADRLERVWMDDIISNEEYEEACVKLIQQFKNARKAYERSVPDLAQFGADYRCNAVHGVQFGYNRLITGIPATREHDMVRTRDYQGRGQRIHACTEAFISLLDCFEMGNSTAEELAPLVRVLLNTLSRVEGLETGFKFKAICQAWVEKIGAMSAFATLSAEDLANFKMQVLAGYDEYSAAL
jgi:hypothetical protein